MKKEYFNNINLKEITSIRNVNKTNIQELLFYYSYIINIINLTITFLQSNKNQCLDKLNLLKNDINKLENKDKYNPELLNKKNLYYFMRNIFKIIHSYNNIIINEKIRKILKFLINKELNLKFIINKLIDIDDRIKKNNYTINEYEDEIHILTKTMRNENDKIIRLLSIITDLYTISCYI